MRNAFVAAAFIALLCIAPGAKSQPTQSLLVSNTARDAINEGNHWYGIARGFYKDKDYGKGSAARGNAVDAYKKAIQKDPKAYDAWLKLGDLYNEHWVSGSDQWNAVEDFKNALALKPGDARILNRLGTAQNYLDQHPAAASAALEDQDMKDFVTRYTAAWCSQDPARVANFFAENGSLKINDGAPSVGRAAITEAARGFMSAFPDMVVAMDALDRQGDAYIYRWTLTGTNTGPGGTGNKVRISGYEEWTIGPDGLVAASLGHFDAADYDRQLAGN